MSFLDFFSNVFYTIVTIIALLVFYLVVISCIEDLLKGSLRDKSVNVFFIPSSNDEFNKYVLDSIRSFKGSSVAMPSDLSKFQRKLIRFSSMSNAWPQLYILNDHFFYPFKTYVALRKFRKGNKVKIDNILKKIEIFCQEISEGKNRKDPKIFLKPPRSNNTQI